MNCIYNATVTALSQILVPQSTLVVNAINQFAMENLYDNYNKWYRKSYIEMRSVVSDCYTGNSN